jgi:hypothetical protein
MFGTNTIKKVGIDLFFYFLKGARIDAALKFNGNSRSPKERFLKPGSKPIESDNIYDSNDFVTRWELISYGQLILKNNSKNYAYNIELINAKEIFSTISPLEKLTSIAPNEKLELEVKFIQYVMEDYGHQADQHSGIPKSLHDKILVIQYENESGTKFFTKSYIDYQKIYNVYTTK